MATLSDFSGDISDIKKGSRVVCGDEELVVSKIINGTTVEIKYPWVKWFWKIKVPRWMMYKISFTFINRWTRYVWKDKCFFIIWLGCELSHNGGYNHYPGAHHFDITILNFGFTVNLFPPGPRPWGINYV